MPTLLRARLAFVALAVCTIAVGLAVHFHASSLPPWVRDMLGDGLWAMMIAWWVAAAAPGATPRARGLAAFAISVAVEASQLYHGPVVDGWRRTMVGQLVLGSGFDPRDLAAYALGVLAAVLIEWAAGLTQHPSG